ncbi:MULTISPECIES: PhzF family phenazine biosynthesis protein [Paraburkholderia]|uniref:PhzF family phenazine biosynthesis protein n=1 Tax=Paraburkholderia TaxID=1822464 RepID=UPI00224FB55D|nr:MULTISPECIES: PhzF family phenazine biosynthesis protein [Paraburkholderia]MCX4161781.1 PhzF family phenazine biosynthesis protein [Paraburkholderia megapolitana]MDN7157278.1 PhzF family phenazine biosynthesis protein [Paraburkholderia sp. CHISQ3]MDQ6494323.1 PhzF family phenazine biosynthesis protein [Paraburkholderia megapolitana]
MHQRHRVELVNVFAAGPGGGNPAPIVVDAAGMTDEQMREVARHYGYESGFVFPAAPDSGCDFEFRFWVPNHEMSMCGHATVGALWLLERIGRLQRDHASIWTRSGRVDARITRDATGATAVEISQPAGRIEPLPDAEQNRADILDVLGIVSEQLAALPIQNACTSRVKTLIPLANASDLDTLEPRLDKVEALCERIGSTGLYPYVTLDASRQIFDARQFPKSSGYPEDAATGIAASALAFGLLSNDMVEASDRVITIRQGRVMQRPSEILVRFSLYAGRPDRSWLGGTVQLEQNGTTSS